MAGEVVLSPREIEALRMVAAGATSGQIARSMGVGVNTAKTYVRRALDKLGCNTRAEAAAVASRRGLL
jgi:DNA-binding CsgD family transcriptional regulator